MMSFVFWDVDDDGDVHGYPADAWHTMRDQGSRAADDCVRVVIRDVADMLADNNSPETLRALKLAEEADALFGDDSSGWVDAEEDEDAPEKLQDILRDAENLPNVYVQWNGDAGTVYVTLADKWQTFTDAEARDILPLETLHELGLI